MISVVSLLAVISAAVSLPPPSLLPDADLKSPRRAATAVEKGQRVQIVASVTVNDGSSDTMTAANLSRNVTGISASAARSIHSRRVECETEPFCMTQDHPVPDDVQLKVLQTHFDRLRPFFERDSDQAELYRSDFANDPEDGLVQACEVKVYRVERPTEVRDAGGQRHFLLNPEGGEYHQSIYITRCRGEKVSCRAVEMFLALNEITSCRTRYWQRSMTAVRPATLETYEVLVRVPSSCNCLIKKPRPLVVSQPSPSPPGPPQPVKAGATGDRPRSQAMRRRRFALRT